MFARFTPSAREAVELAQEEARELSHGYIGTEHLLLGLLRGNAGHGVRALDLLAIGLQDIRSAVTSLIGQESAGGLNDTDAAALRSIGIDLDEVRRRVEESFGPGALDRPAEPTRGRRRCGPVAGHIPFTPRAKKVLELSLREARALGHGFIGTEHLLLALVREPSGLAAQILAQRGATPRRVRAIVLAELGRDLPGRSA